MKTCQRCGESKPLDDFYRHRGNRSDGRRGTCKTCLYPKKPVLPSTVKKCSRCKIVKPLDEFYKNVTLYKGVQAYCIPCAKEYRKGWEQANAEAIALRDAKKRAQADAQDLTKLKVCRSCGEERPLLEFYAHRSTADRRANNCRKCSLAVSAAWRAANREKVRENNKRWVEQNGDRAKKNGRRALLRLYGLTPEQYDEMREAQGGVCWICREDGEEWAARNLHVDHDHETNKVRGLLCGRCNMLLGYAKDSPDLLARSIEYLRVHTD